LWKFQIQLRPALIHSSPWEQLLLRRWLFRCGIVINNIWGRIKPVAHCSFMKLDGEASTRINVFRGPKLQDGPLMISLAAKAQHLMYIVTVTKEAYSNSSQTHKRRIPKLCMNPNFYHYHSFFGPQRNYWFFLDTEINATRDLDV
jgi:hypothetical protein